MLGYVFLLLGAAIYLPPFMRFVLGMDEGTLLVGAERIAHGQVFARDFFEVIGPGTFYLLAAWFKAFGVDFVTARAYLFVNLLATAAIVYFLSRRICRHLTLLPCAILAGTYFGFFSVGVSHHIDGNLYALLALVCLIHWQSRRGFILVAASGIFLAVATCIMQPKGILLLFAVLVWLVVQRKKMQTGFLPIIVISGSYVLVIALVLTYFWSQGALRSLIYANYLFPRQNYSAINVVPYAYGLREVVWRVWVGVFGDSAWGKIISAFVILPEILIALLPILAPILAARYKFALDRPEILLLWLGGYALWLSEAHRVDIVHLTYGSPILLVLFAHFLERYRSNFARGTAIVILFSAGALAFWSFTAVVLGAKPIATRAGTVTSIDPEAAHVLGYLDENVKAGANIFVYPYAPTYYFLSETVNPSPYSIMVYGYNTPEQFREVTEILDERKVRIVVWDTRFIGAKDRQAFPRALHPNLDQMIIEPYLQSHYTQVADYGGVWIMQRMDK